MMKHWFFKLNKKLHIFFLYKKWVIECRERKLSYNKNGAVGNLMIGMGEPQPHGLSSQLQPLRDS